MSVFAPSRRAPFSASEESSGCCPPPSQISGASHSRSGLCGCRNQGNRRGAVRLEPCHALFMAVQAEGLPAALDLDPTDPRLAAFLRGEESTLPAARLDGGGRLRCCDGLRQGLGRPSQNRYPGPAPAGRRIDREEQGMITLQPVQDEAGYRLVRQIESRICAAQPARWHFHHGNLGVDRYFFGSGAADFFPTPILFSFGKSGRICAGVPAGMHLPSGSPPSLTAETAASALRAVEACFPEGAVPGTDASRLDLPLVAALRACGYREGSESRFQAVCPLAGLPRHPRFHRALVCRAVGRPRIADRVRYAALPTGSPVTEGMFRAYPPLGGRQHRFWTRWCGIREAAPLVAYLSWWIDWDSRTVMLNPVACVEAYRRQGILKSCLTRGLCAMRDRGLGYAYGYRYPQPPRCRPV